MIPPGENKSLGSGEGAVQALERAPGKPAGFVPRLTRGLERWWSRLGALGTLPIRRRSGFLKCGVSDLLGGWEELGECPQVGSHGFNSAHPPEADRGRGALVSGETENTATCKLFTLRFLGPEKEKPHPLRWAEGLMKSFTGSLR